MKRFFRSFIYAFRGLNLMLNGERNFIIQSSIAFFVIIFGFILKICAFEWLILILSIILILSLEIINSAIETLSDAFSKEKNEQIKKVKDLSAGAVLLASIGALVIGLIIFLPKILLLFQ